MGQDNIAGNVECEGHDSWSLRSTGKSRADLWALATIVAIEEGIDRQNMACEGNRNPYNVETAENMCTQFEGEPGCQITPSRPLIFTTGRKDCDSGTWISTKREKFPD